MSLTPPPSLSLSLQLPSILSPIATDFTCSVDFGLKLSKRLYYGKDQSLSSLPKMTVMQTSSESYVPTAVMVYAVISEPSMVDNPDVPSYQLYVHGRCDLPVLILFHA